MKFSAYFAFLGLGLVAVRAHATPVGMAASIKGQVTMVEGAKKNPLHLLGRVEPGATISCGPNSSAVIVLFKDGSRFQIGANQKAKVSAMSLAGGKRLAALSGPSAGAIELLGQARVGAIMARPAAMFRRLNPTSPSYFETATPDFAWTSEPNAARYTFTLFDGADRIIWSTSTSETSAAYPTDAPPLLEKQPYVWKLNAFAASGKPLSASYWGIVTVLNSQDARDLDATVAKLRADAKTAPDDTPLLLLAETYRYYGVLNGALEVLTDYPLVGKPGIQDATNAIYDSMSPFARALAGRPLPANAYSR